MLDGKKEGRDTRISGLDIARNVYTGSSLCVTQMILFRVSILIEVINKNRQHAGFILL